MVERNYGSNYKFFCLFFSLSRWAEQTHPLHKQHLGKPSSSKHKWKKKKRMGHHERTEESVGFSLYLFQILPN